jgi:hypothetical protein
MESTIIYDELQKLGYLAYDTDKSLWLINEELESSLQLFDFHRKSENRNPINGKPINGNPISGNTESRIPDSQPIINNNDTNNKIGIMNNEENINGNNNNETLEEEIFTFGSSLDLDLEKDELKSEEKSKSKSHIQNSFPILIEHGESLKSILQGDSLKVDDFRDYSDSYIAHIALSIKLGEKDSSWGAFRKDLKYNSKHYGGLIYACRTALDLEFSTNLKEELLSQSNMSEKDLHRHFFGY